MTSMFMCVFKQFSRNSSGSVVLALTLGSIVMIATELHTTVQQCSSSCHRNRRMEG
jgi:hypothetical protein